MGSAENAVIAIAVLLASVIIHENAHGVVALWLGDKTAKEAGRLTLNPVKHFDFVGSLIMPAMMFFTTGNMFGYAKPVPVNPMNLRGKDRWGFAVVALAGPVSNIVLAFIAVFLAKRGVGGLFVPTEFSEAGGLTVTGRVISYLFSFNLLLASFNLLPIPPLDGSRLLRPALSTNARRTLDRIEPYGFLILLGLILWLQQPLFRVVGLIQSGLLRLLPL